MQLPRRAADCETGTRHALVFRIGDRQLALSAERVATVGELARCTRIPSADPTLLGVGHVARRLLAVIDVHARLGVGASRPALPWTCVVLRGEDVAFRVDEVLGLHATPPSGCTVLTLLEGEA